MTTQANRRPRKRPTASQRPRQTELRFRTWGGRRNGAGRKAKRPGLVSHARRVPLAARFPVHICYRVTGEIPSLRQPDLLQATLDCLSEVARQAHDFRVVHYSIQHTHLHLIVEAHQRQALTRGLKGLAIRVAKRINKLLGRRGAVFADRYFERILRSPKQTKQCLNYVLNNSRRHADQAGMRCASDWVDHCSSALYFDGWRRKLGRPPPEHDPPVSPAHTWLLSQGWRRHGLLAPDAVPG